MSSYIETIKVYNGEIYNLEYHQRRYERVLSSFGVDTFKELKNYIEAPLEGLYRCRLVYTAESVEVTYHEYVKRDVNRLKVIFDDEIEYSLKSTSREEIDALYARRGRYDDVLIVQNSLLTDTSIANIALLKDDIWYTPKKPLLEGTTRKRLLDEGKIVPKDIRIGEIDDYSKVALLNAMIDFDIIQEENIRKIIC